MEIFREELKFEIVNIKKVVRLGRKNDYIEHQRPLLVELDTISVKWGLVKQSKRLKDATKETHKKIFIVPDMTPKEREKDKKLREELKSKRDSGEERWFISREELVMKNVQVGR